MDILAKAHPWTNFNYIKDASVLDTTKEALLETKWQRKCRNCSTSFSSLVRFYWHINYCKGCSVTSYCWSCNRQLRFKCLLFKHRMMCATNKHRKARNRRALMRNLASAESWIQECDEELEPEISKPDTDESLVKNTTNVECSEPEKMFSSDEESNGFINNEFIENVFQSTKVTCDFCHDDFETLDDLIVHEKYCTKAPFARARKSINPLYENLSHKIYSCRSCNIKFSKPLYLKKHLANNSSCVDVHFLKVKLRDGPRNDEQTQTARKSFTNYVSPIPRKRKKFNNELSQEMRNSQISVLKNSASGIAKKSFLSNSSQSEDRFYCGICSEEFFSYPDLKMHKSKHFQEKSAVSHHRCPSCLKTFQDFTKLRDHQKKFDHWGKATKTFPIPQQIESDDETAFDTEISRKIKKGDISNTPITFEEHKYIGYSNKLQVIDTVTDSIKEQLKKHPNVCPVCFKKYSTSFIRNRHFKMHTLESAFRCKFCPTMFPRSDLLTMHMQQNHNNYLRYECKQCHLRFPTRIRALQHGSKLHPELPAKLLINERTVPNFVNTTIQSTGANSTGDKSSYTKYCGETVVPGEEFYCDVCELSFLKNCGLQRHLTSKVHREKVAEVDSSKNNITSTKSLILRESVARSVTPPVIDYSKDLTCSVCCLKFSSTNDFVPHRLSHFRNQDAASRVTEDNPYTCEICGKIMGYCQKIQLHLFWHLQDVQLQAGSIKRNWIKSPSPVKSITPTQVPGVTIARKTINRDKASVQELMIGGLVKPLFTCNGCGINFTTKQHHLTHVQQYCKVLCEKSPNSAKCRKTPTIPNKNTNTVATKRTCPTCPQEFRNPDAFEIHKRLCSAKNACTSYCDTCYCIFSTPALYEQHKILFCKSMTFKQEDDMNGKDFKELRNTMQLENSIAGCLRCSTKFYSMHNLLEHMESHTAEFRKATKHPESARKGTNKNYGQISTKDEKTENKVLFKKKSDVNKLESSTQHKVPVSNVKTLNREHVEKAVNFDCYPSIENNINSSEPMDLDENSKHVVEDDEPDSTNSIGLLRKNFSSLLCVLVSDTELMEQLGYGKDSIDEVLVNVLVQMDLTPVNDKELSSSEQFRQNIRVLLDVCIKEQIMKLMAEDEATTDKIVDAALKMFGVQVQG